MRATRRSMAGWVWSCGLPVCPPALDGQRIKALTIAPSSPLKVCIVDCYTIYKTTLYLVDCDPMSAKTQSASNK